MMAKETDDEAEILALIRANHVAFWNNDFDAWQKCFVHAPHTTRFFASRAGGIFVRQGWQDIAERAARQFAERPVINAAFARETTVENFRLRIEGRLAWATFEQRNPTTFTGNAESHTTHEARVFEKHDGKWRIAFHAYLDDHPHYADRALLELDAGGKVIWQSSSAIVAVADDDDLVIRAGVLHVRDRRADQSLQAAIRRVAPHVSGISSVRRVAMPIVLEAGEGLPTKVWWIIGEGGKILFSFGEKGLAEDRLEAAASVYRLSPAQTRVAACVAEGMTLEEIAATMKIKRATARTHLERIFDKTGVRSQPALVRLLLLAAAPA